MVSPGIVAILITSLLWGLSFVSIKVAVAAVPPTTLALLRFLIAALTLYICLRWQEPKSRLSPADRLPMALTGIIGVTLYFFFQNTGILYTSASEASLILASIPILTLLADIFYCKTQLRPIQMFGIFLSLPGVYLLLQKDAGSAGSWQGNLYMLGAAVSWVVYCLATRPLGQRYSQLAIVTYQTLFGTLALIPLSLFEHAQWQMPPFSVWLHIFYLGLFCSALAYFLYLYSMEKLGVSTVALFINLVPMVSLAGGFFLLGESITPLQFCGGAVILIAVAMVTVKKGSPAKKKSISA